MVSPLGELSAIDLASRLRGFLGRKVGPDLTSVSQRELSRLTGLPRTTLQDFLKDPGRRRASTVANIAAKLQSSALQIVRTNLRTVRVDAPVFTRDSLRSVSRPNNPRGFQFIYAVEENPDYPKRVGQTMFVDTFNANPEDYGHLVPGGEGNIVSVLWYTD